MSGSGVSGGEDTVIGGEDIGHGVRLRMGYDYVTLVSVGYFSNSGGLLTFTKFHSDEVTIVIEGNCSEASTVSDRNRLGRKRDAYGHCRQSRTFFCFEIGVAKGRRSATGSEQRKQHLQDSLVALLIQKSRGRSWQRLQKQL